MKRVARIYLWYEDKNCEHPLVNIRIPFLFCKSQIIKKKLEDSNNNIKNDSRIRYLDIFQ